MDIPNSSSSSAPVLLVSVIPIADVHIPDGKITESLDSLASKPTSQTSTANLISTQPWYSSPKSCLSNISFIVYCSHALSNWGDRMWSFAVGLFLIDISPKSLRLTATYGLTSGVMLFLLGAIIGDWVDKTERLKAARIALFVQNTCVLLCACLVGVYLTWIAELTSYLEGTGTIIAKVLIIGLAIVARLASLAGTISVRNDWVAVICARESSKLTTMTTALRRIDLVTKLLSPVIVGQIMTYISVVAGCLFIAIWNFVSVFIEYFLLYKVYQAVPNLSKKKKDDDIASDANDDVTGEIETTELQAENEIKTQDNCDYKSQVSQGNSEKAFQNEKKTCCKCGRHPFFTLLCSMIFKLVNGWQTYISYNVSWAGFGLGLLYMTVLGFDNITTGFAYSQGVNESILGILMAVGAITGILATFIYPVLKRKVGLPRTGLISFSLEIICLVFCLLSIVSPGNPYGLVPLSPECVENGNTTTNYTQIDVYNSSTPSSSNAIKAYCSYISVSLLMLGIITARFGLWMSDLTVNQLLLENVNETKIGVVIGVQNSLNMLMDLLKFLLVILVPEPSDFWLLISISYIFICFGGISFAKYALFKSGHFEICTKERQNRKQNKYNVHAQNT